MFVKEKESLFSSSEETDIPEDQNKISPKGTIWKKIKDDVSSGRPIHNIFKDVAGLTGYAKKNIIKSTVRSGFSLIINDEILKHKNLH